MPEHFAPSQDGLVAPTYDPPEWLDDKAAITDDALELAKYLHESAESRATAAETRGGRIAQTSLTLLTLTFAVTGFLAARLRTLSAPTSIWILGLAPAGIAIVSLALSALQAMGIEQRVRLGFAPILDDVVEAGTDEQRRVLVEQEDRAAFIANWSATKRLDELLQARAWLTRGVVALIFAGFAVVASWASPI